MNVRLVYLFIYGLFNVAVYCSDSVMLSCKL